MRLFGLIFVLLFSFSYSQPLDWTYVNTGGNATIAISSDDFSNITFNNSSIPDGSLIGVFYINDSGDYTCGGFSSWDSTAPSMVVTAWGSEFGEDNGFANGEIYSWFLQINGEDYGVDSNGATMNIIPPFSNTYSCFCSIILLYVVRCLIFCHYITKSLNPKCVPDLPTMQKYSRKPWTRTAS